MNAPTDIEATLSSLIRAAVPASQTVNVFQELRRALNEREYPAVVIQFAKSDMEPELAGNEKRFARPSGYEIEHQFHIDIYTRGKTAAEAIARIYEQVFSIDSAFNDQQNDMTMYWTGGNRIEYDETMQLDIQATRLTCTIGTSE